ncbi:hypothetical protein IPL68_06745 [Candidatus Saccharibacteria bacterium]|nr:MAG: hypothetical protein IPL68_06745 [Candidatus Saccharibacteria bacterium]
MPHQHLICYIPVIHDGYLKWLADYPDASIHILGDHILTPRFDYLRKDIRALPAKSVIELLRGIGRNATEVKEASEVKRLLQTGGVIMPDDDISHALAAEFRAKNVVFEPVFLRWDRKAVETNLEVMPDRTLSMSADDPIVLALSDEAAKSTNWWRNVGAALVTNGQIVSLAHNNSVPTEYSSALDGDPRILAQRGSAIDTSIDIHAESRLIADAASRGTKLAGSAIYITTFPCPTCAKLIAASGIRHCYFVEGYASLDGQSILKANDVEIIKIETRLQISTRQKLTKYPKA